MSGSTAALVKSVAPESVRSVQGETNHAHAGSLGALLQDIDERHGKAATGAIAADGNALGGTPMRAQKAPGRHCVVQCGGERVFGR
jgi:hypothetical protein